MKKRNNNATCGNCPYWHQNPQSTCGNCQAVSWTCIEKLDTEWCGQHPDFWEAEAAKVSITYTDGDTECVAVEQSESPTLEDVLAAYRTAVEMARCYTGRICDRCANARTVTCGRCLVGWQLLYKPKEDAQ